MLLFLKQFLDYSVIRYYFLKMIKIDTNKCISCELCVQSCTTKAINPLEGIVNESRCMSCSHCVAVCPTDAVSQDDKISRVINNHNINPENFENLIYARKSIRNFKTDEIDDDTLKTFLNLMEYAPTGTNSQETYVTVIRGREKIKPFSESIIKYFQRTLKMFLTPAAYPFIKMMKGKEKADKLYSYKKHILDVKEGHDIITYNCPLIIVFHASPKSSTPEMDCNIQASYASLHAVTLGLGTCFNGFICRGINGDKKIKSDLKIPKDHKVFSSLLVGYPELKYKKRVIRQELKVNIVA